MQSRLLPTPAPTLRLLFYNPKDREKEPRAVWLSCPPCPGHNVTAKGRPGTGQGLGALPSLQFLGLVMSIGDIRRCRFGHGASGPCPRASGMCLKDSVPHTRVGAGTRPSPNPTQAPSPFPPVCARPVCEGAVASTWTGLPSPGGGSTHPGVTDGGMTRMTSSRAWCSASAMWVSMWMRPLRGNVRSDWETQQRLWLVCPAGTLEAQDAPAP